MRADPEPFSTTNRGKAKNPRYVVEIVYTSGSIFLTSHSDITGLPGGGACPPIALTGPRSLSVA